MWSLLKGTLMLRWPGLIVTAIVLASGTAVVAVNGSLLDAGIRGGHDEVISLSAVFGGLTVMIMVTLVCVAFSLTLAQRGAEMALGRAVGVSPGQLRSLVTLEALTIGLVSSSLGLVLSVPLSTQILAVMADAGIAPASLEVPPKACLAIPGGARTAQHARWRRCRRSTCAQHAQRACALPSHALDSPGIHRGLPDAP